MSQLIFERGTQGHRGVALPKLQVPAYTLKTKLRAEKPQLPSVSELEVVRHYTRNVPSVSKALITSFIH